MNRTGRYLSGLLLLLSFFIFLTKETKGQSTDDQLAFQYLQNKEYDKAVVYFEKLYGQKDGLNYYPPYLLCLTQLKQYDKAEKTIRKLIKQNPKNPIYLIDLGTLYKEKGDSDKGNTQYEKAIRLLSPDQQQVLALANEFINLKEWDFALAAYQQGKKLLNGFYPFSAEIAEVYEKKGDVAGMAREYLSLLEYGDDQIQAVQNGLQPTFGDERDEQRNEIVRNEILKKAQSVSDRTIYSELLIWFFVQEKNFNGAFVQSKALDKRFKEDGQRLMILGQLCLSNEEYETAAKCYRYVIEKGRENYYYLNARMELLNSEYKRITTRYDYTAADLSALEQEYRITLDELGRSSATALLMKSQAHLLGFFMNQPEQAEIILHETIALPGLNEKTKAECKLELGDVMLMKGEVWDASLLYSQVTLDFKHEPMGDEAKLKNARLSYFNGEFGWAQAQLDVLKGSTEKLIANDAMALSILISDNSNGTDDSLALCMYARAGMLLFRNLNAQVLLTLDSINKRHPSSSLSDDILFKRYQIRMKEGKFSEAAGYLQKLIENYGFDILGDDALFYLAELNERYLNNPEKAKELYEELLTKHSGSLFTVEARKRFRRLRGDVVN